RHDVRGDPHQLHGYERDQHGDRQGQDDYQGALEVEQEEQDDQRDYDRLLQKVVFQGIDGPLNKVGAVVGDHDLHAGRQSFLQLLDLDLDPVDDILGVLAVAHDHDAADRLTLTVHVEHAAPDGAPHLHRTQVPEVNRRAAHVGRHHDVLQVGLGFHVAAAADQILGIGLFDQLATDILVGDLDRFHDLG